MTTILELMHQEIFEGRIISGIATTVRGDDYPVTSGLFDYLYDTAAREQYESISDTSSSIRDTDDEDSDTDCNEYSTVRNIINQKLLMASTDEQFDEVIELMRHYKQSRFDGDCVVLIEHPKQLDNYLTLSCLSVDDLAEMLSRCIENDTDWAFLSFNILIEELEDLSINDISELRLLDVRNTDLYKLANSYNLHDSYYESKLAGEEYIYKYESPLAMWRRGKIVTYREMYHMLLYGTDTHRQEIHIYLNFYPSFDALSALRNFYKLPENASIQMLKDALDGLTNI